MRKTALNSFTSKLFAFSLIVVLSGIFCHPSFSREIPQEDQWAKYRRERAEHFDSLPIGRNDIVFLGNSITEGGKWSELFGMSNVLNRGVGGDSTPDIMRRLDVIVNNSPAKVFLMIGINDLASRLISPEELVVDISRILDRFRDESPETKVYVQSILPVNPDFPPLHHHLRNDEAAHTNRLLQIVCRQRELTWIDLTEVFSDPDGFLDKSFTWDGVHLNDEGYSAWSEAIRDYVLE